MRSNRVRGQALVETLVVAIALVPLAVLIVLLGKYQTIQSATVAASRSLAFDCAARPRQCTDAAASAWLVESLRARHFTRPDRALLSGERVAADGSAAAGASGGSPAGGAGPGGIDRHPLWQDRAGRPLLERLADVGGTVSSQHFGAGVGTATGRAASADLSGIGGAAAAVQVLDRLAGPARFGLAIDGGLLDARVQVSVAPSHAANVGFARLDPLAVPMRARTAILTDAWQASGPQGGAASVAARVESGARLDALREARLSVGYQLTRWAIDLMGALGLEPSARHFRYHQADPDAVPADRIGQP
jgi:hypothetical protein